MKMMTGGFLVLAAFFATGRNVRPRPSAKPLGRPFCEIHGLHQKRYLYRFPTTIREQLRVKLRERVPAKYARLADSVDPRYPSIHAHDVRSLESEHALLHLLPTHAARRECPHQARQHSCR